MTETCYICGNVYDPRHTSEGRGPDCPMCEVLWRIETLEQNQREAVTVDTPDL